MSGRDTMDEIGSAIVVPTDAYTMLRKLVDGRPECDASFGGSGSWLYARALNILGLGALCMVVDDQNTVQHFAVRTKGQYTDFDGTTDKSGLLTYLASVGVRMPVVREWKGETSKTIIINEDAAQLLAKLIKRELDR